MSYVPKTDWKYSDVLTEKDMNRIESGIEEGKQLLEAHSAAQNNPHGVTSEQVGAETPSGAQTKVDTHATTPTGAHKASAIALDDTGSNFNSPDIEGAMIELFNSVSNGKSLVATAITGKGGTVAGTAPYTFQTLANGVNGISIQRKEVSGTGSASHAAGTSPSRQTIPLSFMPSRAIVVLKHQNGNYNAPDTIAIKGFTDLTQLGGNNAQSSGQGKSSYGYVNITLQENGFYFDTTLTSTGSSIIANSTTYKWWAME